MRKVAPMTSLQERVPAGAPRERLATKISAPAGHGGRDLGLLVPPPMPAANGKMAAGQRRAPAAASRTTTAGGALAAPPAGGGRARPARVARGRAPGSRRWAGRRTSPSHGTRLLGV